MIWRLLGMAAVFLSLNNGVAAMTMSLEDGRLVLSGEFTDYTAGNVISTLRDNPGIRTVVLRRSPGGVGGGMLELAQELRTRRITTMVDGPCVSACAVVFMGGVRRTYAPGARPTNTFVALHGVYQEDGERHAAWEPALISAIVRLSSGLMRRDLMTEIARLPQNGYAAFFHPSIYRRPDGATVALCFGREARRTSGCASLQGVDGFSAGIFTH